MEALSTALVAVGSGLQTIVQFTILYFILILTDGKLEKRACMGLGGDGECSPMPILIICLVFSFMSASYNMGRAIMSQMSKGTWTFVLNTTGIFGGIYTFGALFLRCTTVASIILQMRHYSSLQERFNRDSKFDPAGLISVATLYFGVGLFLLPYSIGLLLVSSNKIKRNVRSWETQVEVIVVACISAIIGTLYPTVHYGYKDNTPGNPRQRLCKCIALVTSLNMLPDVLAWISLAALQKSTCAQHYPMIIFRSADEHDEHGFKGYLGFVLVLAILSCNLCFLLFSACIPGLATCHVAGGWCQHAPSQSVEVFEREDITANDPYPMDKLV